MELPLNIAVLSREESQINDQVLKCYEPYSIICLQTDSLTEFQEHIQQLNINVIAICESALNRKEQDIVIFLEEIASSHPHSIIYFYAMQSGTEQDIESENVITFYSFNFGAKKLTYDMFLQHIENYFGITKSKLGAYRIKTESSTPSNFDETVVEQNSEIDKAKHNNEEYENACSEDVDSSAKKEVLSDNKNLEEIKIHPVKENRTFKEKNKQYYDELSREQQEKLQTFALESVKEMSRELQFKTLKSSHAQTRNIAVISGSPRAGASFLINNLAIALAQLNIHSAVLEAPQLKAHLYYALQKKIPTSWQCVYAYAHKHKKITSNNFIQYKGVYWMPFHPRTFDNKSFTIQYLPSLICFYTAATLPILFVDISSSIESGFTEDVVLPHIDEVWFVLEDNLNALPYDLERISKVMDTYQGKKYEFILNQCTEYTDLRSITELLGKDPLLQIPYHLQVKKAAAKNTFCYLTKEGQEWLSPLFKPLFTRLIKPDSDKLTISSLKHFFQF